MSFVITCPGCSARFRSAKERPLGTGVECRKCGERFYVTPDSQASERTSRPAASAEKRGKQSRDLSPDDEQRSSRRRSPEDEDAASPDRRRHEKGHGKLIVVLAVVGMAFLTASAVGAYFLIFRGGLTNSSNGPSSRAASRIRPQRELPTEMFLYNTGRGCGFNYYNLDELRQARPVPPQWDASFQQHLPVGNGITLSQVSAYCVSGPALGRPAPGFGITTVIRFPNPVSIDEVAARCKFQPIKVEAGLVFQGRSGMDLFLLLQPAPDRLVVVEYERGVNPDAKLLSQRLNQLLSRTVQTHKLPDDAPDLLKEVSGYPRISFTPGFGRKGETGGEATGQAVNSEVVEAYEVRICESAPSAESLARVNKGKLNGREKEKEIWTKGDRYFVFTVRALGELD